MIPFTRSPCLKQLGLSLIQLTTQTIPLVQVVQCRLYIDEYCVNDDITQMVFTRNGMPLLSVESVSED